jgi:hypothetical protein
VSHDPSRAGGDGTGSSTGRTGHRSTAASILRRRAELARPPLPGSGCRMFRGTAPLRRAAASFANRVVAATMSSGARRRGNDVVGAGPAVSWSGLCGPASPCDHTFSVAWMTSRRTGGVVAQLARPALRGQGAISLGLGAVARTSAASVTFGWSIRASWSIRGPPAPARSTAEPESTTVTGELLRLL